MLIKHILSHFTKFVKTRFLAQKSGSRLRCRTMLKMLWNIQKTPPKHVKRLLNFLFLNTVLGSNIRFSAQMSNNAKKTWNNQKTPTKHVLRLFKNFLKIWFSAQMSNNAKKIPWNTQKTPTKHVLRLFENFLFFSVGELTAYVTHSRLATDVMWWQCWWHQWGLLTFTL